MIVARAIATLLAASAVMSAAHATSYSVSVPTTEPYTRFENFVTTGDFNDSFNFTLSSVYEGYLWLFPQQDAWFTAAADNTKGVTLTLVNNDTETEYTAVLYPTAKGTVSLWEPGVLPLVINGFDPNKSLYLSGSFEPGNYSALISGTATGSQGGNYVLKLSLQPVPEPATFALMGVGLVGIGLLSRRKGAHTA